MRCIVTGFDAFGELETNPSQLAVQSLPAHLSTPFGQIMLDREILASCCAASWEKLQDHMNNNVEECFVLLTGLAHDRDRITAERFALNIRDYRIVDNGGHQWLDQTLDAAGPEAIRNDLPLVPLEHHLNERGYYSDISNHAGSFICNEIYYRCLRYRDNHPRITGVLFVHLPAVELYANNFSPRKADNHEIIEIYAAALKEIITFCGNWLCSIRTFDS